MREIPLKVNPATPSHVIDCDANPFVPKGWSVEEHHKRGMLEWNANCITLYLNKEQQTGTGIEGNKLLKELANKPVLNANVLDYLLANPHLIPEEWKNKCVFFWGTIYNNGGGYLCVRYLDCDHDSHDWGVFQLKTIAWLHRDPAAVLDS